LQLPDNTSRPMNKGVACREIGILFMKNKFSEASWIMEREI
jgi:hypothetical protein